MIRCDAGMPTTRFCQIIGVPERTWSRRQARQRSGEQARAPGRDRPGSRPRPARQSVREAARAHALAHPAWGHRKVWAMVRHEGLACSQATILRVLRDVGLILPAAYQRERRQLAQRRKAAFAEEPTGANQVWQLDFSEFETNTGGTWRIAGCRDYWSKYEYPWHVSPTANQHDAITAIETALEHYEALFGHPLIETCQADENDEVIPALAIVTDNSGPFRSFRFEHFITSHPELRHVRTTVRTPGQNVSRERGFGTLKYERLFLEEIDDVLALVEHADAYRSEYNQIRPHEALAWNRPLDVHLGHADPYTPTFPTADNLPTT